MGTTGRVGWRGHSPESHTFVLPSPASYPTGFLGVSEISRICALCQELPGTVQVPHSDHHPWHFCPPLLPSPHTLTAFVPSGLELAPPHPGPPQDRRRSPRSRVERRPQPRARRQPRGRAALIRCSGDCGARDAPAPRRAPAGAASVSLQPRGHREPCRCSRGADPECQFRAPEDSNGEPPKPARCRPLPTPPRWTVYGATGKVRVFYLFQ